MPYGLPKPLDTPANNKKIEDCVKKLMDDPKFKPKGGGDKKTVAIKVCKAQLMKKSEHSELPISFTVCFAEKGIPREIHIIPLGEWDHTQYGKIKITNRDIKQFVENFKAKVRRDIPITEGHEVSDEKPAIGWFKKLTAKQNGLWAKVEWTEEGKELLSKKKYKYFSPEFYRIYDDPETHEVYTNVLIGGALTNKPYFKDLKQIVFSEKSIINQFNNTYMNLKDILKKEAGSLNAEEKNFLKSKMSELGSEDLHKFAEDLAPEKEENEGEENKEGEENNEGNEENKKSGDDNKNEGGEEGEENKEGDEGDKGGEKEGENKEGDGKVEGSEKNVIVKASEYKALQEKADQGAEAFAELRKTNFKNEVEKFVFSEQNREGKIFSKIKDTVINFMLGLKSEQLTTFREIVKSLPKVNMFGEIGDMGNDNAGDGINKEVETSVKKLQEKDSALKYSDAVRQVFDANQDLAKRYNEAHA